jgi:hypothetical protein
MLVLVRDIRKGDAILGCLFLNGTFICYTLENADKAIPEGVYNIENSKSPKFKRELPLVYNKTVKASRGIRVHRGNTVKDSAGCILVGMGRNYVRPNAEPSLLESASAETMVTMLCRNVTKLAVTETAW